MSSITSSIGLMSGLPIQDIIDAYIESASRPMNLLQDRVENIQIQRTAFLDLSARLASLKGIVSRFGNTEFFQTFKSHSSNESVMTALTGTGAQPGTYQFRVHSLVSNHQLIARGFADPDTTPVGAGSLTVEIGNGKLNPSTELDSLAGGEGIRRGRITLVDGNGNTAQIDLRAAVTVDDVLDAINSQTDAMVQAQVSGDRITIEDRSGGPGPLQVSDAAGGFAAQDLGIAGTSAEGRIEGADVMNLADSTLLSALNDGNGVRRNSKLTTPDFRITAGVDTAFVVSLSSFLQPTTRLEQLNSGNGVRMDDGSGNPPGIIRITDRSGTSAEIDLSSAKTVQDVQDLINAANVGVTATYVSSHLQLRDETGTPDEEAATFTIEDVSGYAARDLGIAGATEGDSIIGSDIFRISTIGDVIRAINFAEGNDDGSGMPEVTASLSDNGIHLSYNSIAGAGITVQALDRGDGTVSQAAADLGIEGEFGSYEVQSRDLIAGLNTVLLQSLNGGAGVEVGSISITNRNGLQTTYNFAGAQTVQDILDIINDVSDTSGISARLNSAGNGIEIVDATGSDTGPIRVEEIGGTTAADLGIAGESNDITLVGTNTQLRYVSEATRLEDMNFGQGVRTGKFRLTNSLGAAFTVNVTENQTTVGEILELINSYSDVSRVVATINPNGDGILLTDNAGGTETLRVEDLEGGPADDLRIAGEAAADTNIIDGTMEITIAIDADDTLDDVVSRINDSGGHLSASVVNDGSATNPYRLTIASQVSGRRGELTFDAGDTGLSARTLVEARDAVLFLGDPDAPDPIVIASSTNSISDVVPGLTLNLVGTSADPVTLSVSQDLDRIVSDLESFVTNFNAVQDRIDEYTDFDEETETRGVLLGDSTVRRIQDGLNRAVLRPFNAGSSALNRLADIGVRFRSGARLEFDEERFREVYTDNPEVIEELFTDPENGIGAALDELLDEMTRSDDGLIDRQNATLEKRAEDLNSRIAAMQVLLDGRRSRLERQFQGLESALAELNRQQSALAALSALANPTG
ncbi:MAG: flagellar filament capping protein FliD [Phycisphaerales bacterium]|nr:MAG: flagellar filament capping protein FliD [Phycisphaerales bacterium]